MDHVRRQTSRAAGALLQLWFSRVLRDGFAAQLAGAFVPFKQLAQAHLEHLLAEQPQAPT